MNSQHSELEVMFAHKGLRLTAPRLAVFDALQQAGAPMAINEIIKKCPTIDRVSIYRTIDVFIQLGITEVVPVGWKKRYELTSPFKSHHHHLYCTQCSKLIDVHSKKLELLVASLVREYHFMPHEHKFEISGLCEACQGKSV